ncbi:hypothetical protein L2E82_43455 [Cichorium intybus]|uniref:Uncharacterized protein n=1 Tax=Cichorium intybus TaxID=13427 RepID=A0ACB8ZPM0_CICIN|nr:hypothetical protein L2E82_43455 [Cichorium intybus]
MWTQNRHHSTLSSQNRMLPYFSTLFLFKSLLHSSADNLYLFDFTLLFASFNNSPSFSINKTTSDFQ